jgi:hypothetical protein
MLCKTMFAFVGMSWISGRTHAHWAAVASLFHMESICARRLWREAGSGHEFQSRHTLDALQDSSRSQVTPGLSMSINALRPICKVYIHTYTTGKVALLECHNRRAIVGIHRCSTFLQERTTCNKYFY